MEIVPARRDDAVVTKLQEQPGVGVVTATVMRAVIGRFDRFRAGKQLSRDCGVPPCNSSSGRRQADAGLIESGNDSCGRCGFHWPSDCRDTNRAGGNGTRR